MLCQAILSAVAVTCTLSRIHANGQSTQHSDLTKDLMCVLILNGIQKEDLDTSLLKKFQQHNVNIDDLNNEENANKCKEFNLQNIKRKIATSERTRTTPKNIKELNKQNQTNSVIKLQHTFHKGNVPPSNTEKAFTATDSKILFKQKIVYTDGTPKQESVLKFWNEYTKKTNYFIQTTSDTPSSFVVENNNVEEINKRFIPKYKDAIDKVLSSILSTTNDAEESTITSTPVNNIYEDLLSSFDKTSNNNKAYENNRYSLFNILDKIEADNNNEFLEQKSEPSSIEFITPHTFMSFREMLASIDKKTAYPFALEPTTTKDIFIDSHEESKLSYGFYPESLMKPNKDISKNITNTPNPPMGIIPQDIIKDIADSVKVIILRDMRKEIQTTKSVVPTTTLRPTTTEITTSTTHGAVLNTTNKKNDTASHESILGKFLELFEQIKTLKSNPIIISRDVKQILKPENKMKPQKSASEMSPHIISTLSSETNKIPNIAPHKVYNLSHQIHKFKPNVNAQIYPFQLNSLRKAKPITIQTNALVIPPIGVILTKPEYPINQNIMLTTGAPVQTRNEKYVAYGVSPGVHEVHPNINNMLKFDNEDIKILQPKFVKAKFDNDLANAEILQPKFEEAPPSLHQKYCSMHDCSLLFKSKLKTKNILKQTSDMDIKVNRHVLYSLDKLHHKKPLNATGFHERLEKSNQDLSELSSKDYKNCCNENNSNQASNCCIRKIPSRHQMSLNQNNSIKRIAYDDSHFQNFLKSQQKVTDMLERILAVKNKLKSVEDI